MIGVDYASPSALESEGDRALLGLTANARRPVKFQGRLIRNIPLFRFALRALGEVIWSNDHWGGQGDFMGAVLDPVITVHPDRIFFEAFSQDQSAYALLVADPAMFAVEGEVRTGTTNIDFSAWLWGALNELRSSRETRLRIGPEGFEVKTAGAGGRFQQKVDLPDSWVRGFLQVTGAMAMPGTRLTVRPVDLLAAIRYLRYTKAKLSPRALRYEMNPGADARLVLEPWEHAVPLRGATHNYSEPRVIRTWGRRRLSLIEGLLPFASSVDIYLKGRGLPSFYAVKLPDLTFVLGLSGWSDQAWTDSGSFDLLGNSTAPQTALLPKVLEILAARFTASPKALAETLGEPVTAVWSACERLCRQGRAIFDVETRAFRHRELFEEPVDEAKYFPPNLQFEQALAFQAQNAVRVSACEVQETRKQKKLYTPEGPVHREVVLRDWRVRGAAGTQREVEIVVAETGRIIFGTCGCRFFQDHLLGQGPCAHMLALFRASAEARQDLPTSEPAATPAARPPRQEKEEDDDDQEEIDDEDEPSENEAR
jgi:hypothetical protein